MLIKIGEFEFTECWDGVLYKKLSDYPKITDWEKQTVLDFIRYESEYGRTCEIEAEESILHAIDTYRASYEKGNRVTPPIKITECTACPKYKGCMTDLVCHTSPVDSRGGQQDHDQIPGFIRAIHEQGTGQRLSRATPCRAYILGSAGLFCFWEIWYVKIEVGSQYGLAKISFEIVD